MAKRTGSVSQFRGKWRVRLTVDGKRRSAGIYDTKDQAERVLAALLKRTETRRVLTLRRWGDEWLTLRERDGYHRDVRSDRDRWRARVESQPWIDDPLDAISHQQIRLWVREMVAEGKARSTVSNALCLLRGCLRYAREEDLIKTNPADGVRVPKMAQRDETWTWLKQPEIEALLSARSSSKRRIVPHQRTALIVAVYTGLRAGELWGLRWGAVHLDDERPHLLVRRSYNGPTKAGTVRRVPLLGPATEALRAQRRLVPGLPNAVVWPAMPVGLRASQGPGQVHAKGYDCGLAAWRKAADLRPFRFHDLRHTCASHLLQGTWGIKLGLAEVRDWLGHGNVSTTERYAHLCPNAILDKAKDFVMPLTTSVATVSPIFGTQDGTQDTKTDPRE